MSYVNPTVTEFKDYFARDFPFGSDADTEITNGDISKAMGITDITIPQALFPSQNFYTIGYMYLTAHNLVESISASTQGISGRYEWAIGNKSVGSVSVGYNIPDTVLKNPALTFLTKTTYGAKYLELVYPFLIGPVGTVKGTTLP